MEAGPPGLRAGLYIDVTVIGSLMRCATASLPRILVFAIPSINGFRWWWTQLSLQRTRVAHDSDQVQVP